MFSHFSHNTVDIQVFYGIVLALFMYYVPAMQQIRAVELIKGFYESSLGLFWLFYL